MRSGRRSGAAVADHDAAQSCRRRCSAAPFFPYYYTYYSPIMEAAEAGRQNPNFGYGEGLDLAAAYLEAEARGGGSTAMAFYGRGPFSYFFSGRTEPLKTVYAEAENVPQLQEILRQSDYLVIYYALQHGRNSPANLMRALEGSTPETDASGSTESNTSASTPWRDAAGVL